MTLAWAVYLPLLLSGTLLGAGALKLATGSDPDDWAGFGMLPRPVRTLAARVLAPVELALGVVLVLVPGDVLAGAAWSAAAMMLVFTVVVAQTLRRGERPVCHCFGQVGDEPISGRTLVRNLCLTALAVVVASGARPGDGVIRALVRANVDERLTVLSLVAATLAAVALGARQQRLESRWATSAVPVAGGAAPGTAQPTSLATAAIPDGFLVDPGAVSHQLVDLARDRARLLVFVAPDCASCHALVPLLPDWQEALGDELEVTVVSIGSPEATARAYPGHADSIWSDPGSTYADLGVPGTPCALLLGTNGTVGAGPAAGTEAIQELLATVVQALGVNLLTGTAHQSGHVAPSREDQAGWVPEIGSRVPELTVVREDRSVSSLVDALDELSVEAGGSVVAVAWRHDCGYCEEILPRMRAASVRGDVVLVVDEDIATVRAQGICGPVLQVMPPGNAVGALGVPGTPAAVPIHHGVVVGLGGLGGPHTLEVLRERAEGRLSVR